MAGGVMSLELGYYGTLHFACDYCIAIRTR